MTNTTCPNCGISFTVTDDAADYDWNSGTYGGGVKEIACPYCRKELAICVTATVDIEDVRIDD